jgi:hypothetical protein
MKLPAFLLASHLRLVLSLFMAKILLTRRRPAIRSRPPANVNSPGITEDAFEWACSMCTHATYLSASVQKRVAEKSFRVAYVGIRPAMEGALKSLWVMGKVKKKTIPRSLEPLVTQVEEAFPGFDNIFSVQMTRRDGFGNDGFRKVNGWAHSDPEMWLKYKNGEGIDLVLLPLRNMVAFAQAELLRYEPSLLADQKYWSPKYE